MSLPCTVDKIPSAVPVTAVVRIKHGILHALVKKLGSQAEAAKALGVSQSEFGLWVNFKKRPSRKWGEKKSVEFATKVFEATGRTVDEIWPEWLDEVLGTIETTGERTEYIDELDFKQLQHAEPIKIGSSDELKAAINHVLKSLPYREREIIRLRYGLGDGYSYTLEETARIFKATRERIRQIENKALKKLQHHTRSDHLHAFAGIR